jgi:hypothetical protein
VERLAAHDLVLEATTGGDHIVLRPLTEDDWPWLERWNRDPEVLYWAEGDDVTAWSPAEVRCIYRSVSQTAYCFLMVYNGLPVGECWLQRMNLPAVQAVYAGHDCRRIDLTIGEKEYWGRYRDGSDPDALRTGL